MNENIFIENYASKLNAQQLEAVKTVEGPVLLLAVPGSGKTTVLVHRLGYMLMVKEIPPENILTLTYTVAATRDMAERFVKVFGEDAARNLEFRTINGICAKIISHYARLIGKTSFELITDEKISGKILTDIYVKVMNDYPTESDIKAVRTLITYCKNMCLDKEDIEKLGKDEGLELLKIYEAYNRELKARSLMDYDDQMIYAYRMLKSSPDLLKFYREKYRYICVDEAQDTSKIQHMIIALLAGESGNLFMVGDEDQSIYGFRAAYPEALLHFEKEHVGAKVLVMDKNYRSNAKIVETADKFIQKNFNRHKKHMTAIRDEGADISYVTLNSRESQYSFLLDIARNISVQTAVLYRDNECILPLVDILERENVDYRIKSSDMAFFSHRVVVDVENMLKFALSPMDPELFLKIYFKFQTFLRKQDALLMCDIADRRHCGILDAVEEIDINKRILGNVRSLRTHFMHMAQETPAKAIGRIQKFMGYGEYLKDNNIDDNKLFTLKMLAKNESTIAGFLERLEELKNTLTQKKENYKSKLILSTIHSSKGLEYDTVILMDVVNGVFPGKIIKSFATATPEEKRENEEERRIFYVGVTRAKDKLIIFKYKDKPSVFVGELCPKEKWGNEEQEVPVKKSKKKVGNELKKPISYLKQKKAPLSIENVPSNLVIGDRVAQTKYGAGTIIDVDWDEDEIPTKFVVEFDDKTRKKFMFPVAFNMGMKLED
ncbi:ATP-dependent helicase [Butyrivibrio sp.]|uniref:ATP-dependent helicase n=1 Tax=Butyrivibrio sp. TaxID=28121 RepID=UPI0025C1AE3B|nr:ATP-dependent helicase [Butyrivibrio sp.]